MVIIGARCSKTSYAAVDHKSAIIFQIITRENRLIKHRSHCQVAPIEIGAPYLLTLKGQDNNLASGVYYAQGDHPACVSECSDGKSVKLTKWALFFIKHLIVEFYSHATLPYTLTAAFVKNEDTIGMNYNTNFIALFTSKVFWGFH